MKRFIKSQQLSKNKISKLHTLINAAKRKDQFAIKIYWDVVNNRVSQSYCDYLCHEGSKLIGYLGLFFFEKEQAEITAVVHPDYRHQKVFSSLLQEAIHELNLWDTKYCTMLCPKNAKTIKHFLKTVKAKKINTEYNLSINLDKYGLQIYEPELKLNEAGPKDLSLLATLEGDSFGHDYPEALEHIWRILQEDNHKSWIIYFRKTPISKIHALLVKNTAYIHDFCISHNYREKTYATTILALIMNELKKAGIKKIATDIMQKDLGIVHKNESINWYQKLGFKINAVYEHMQFELKSI